MARGIQLLTSAQGCMATLSCVQGNPRSQGAKVKPPWGIHRTSGERSRFLDVGAFGLHPRDRIGDAERQYLMQIVTERLGPARGHQAGRGQGFASCSMPVDRAAAVSQAAHRRSREAARRPGFRANGRSHRTEHAAAMYRAAYHRGSPGGISASPGGAAQGRVQASGPECL